MKNIIFASLLLMWISLQNIVLAQNGEYMVDIVTTEKSLIKPATRSTSLSGESSNSVNGMKYTKFSAVGNYTIQVSPPQYKPFRITLFDVPEKLLWSINDTTMAMNFKGREPLFIDCDTTIATMTSNGREAFIEFKKDGDIYILVQSGDVVVFRILARAKTFENQAWQVILTRLNEKGEIISK